MFSFWCWAPNLAFTAPLQIKGASLGADILFSNFCQFLVFRFGSTACGINDVNNGFRVSYESSETEFRKTCCLYRQCVQITTAIFHLCFVQKPHQLHFSTACLSMWICNSYWVRGSIGAFVKHKLCRAQRQPSASTASSHRKFYIICFDPRSEQLRLWHPAPSCLFT